MYLKPHENPKFCCDVRTNRKKNGGATPSFFIRKIWFISGFIFFIQIDDLSPQTLIYCAIQFRGESLVQMTLVSSLEWKRRHREIFLSWNLLTTKYRVTHNRTSCQKLNNCLETNTEIDYVYFIINNVIHLSLAFVTKCPPY